MTQRPSAVVILAAGEGTRMRSRRPKVLHPIGGRPMLAHVLATAVVAWVGVGRTGARSPSRARVRQPTRNTGHPISVRHAAGSPESRGPTR